MKPVNKGVPASRCRSYWAEPSGPNVSPAESVDKSPAALQLARPASAVLERRRSRAQVGRIQDDHQDAQPGPDPDAARGLSRSPCWARWSWGWRFSATPRGSGKRAPPTLAATSRSASVAVKLEQGSVEVGVQAQQTDGSWGEVFQPAARYLTARAPVGRQLHSSPVRVPALYLQPESIEALRRGTEGFYSESPLYCVINHGAEGGAFWQGANYRTSESGRFERNNIRIVSTPDVSAGLNELRAGLADSDAAALVALNVDTTAAVAGALAAAERTDIVVIGFGGGPSILQPLLTGQVAMLVWDQPDLQSHLVAQLPTLPERLFAGLPALELGSPFIAIEPVIFDLAAVREIIANLPPEAQ